MKRNQQSHPPEADTPATRKRRLQKRLQEISDMGEKELAGIKKSIDQIKQSFKPKK